MTPTGVQGWRLLRNRKGKGALHENTTLISRYPSRVSIRCRISLRLFTTIS